MNKEKMMEFISKAIDEGARIDIIFNSSGKSMKDAADTSLDFALITGGHTEIVNYNGNTWYKVKTDKFQLDHFYNREKFMVEDVDLSGMESA
jgi:hypothetical protein